MMLPVQAHSIESYNFAVPTNKYFQRNHSKPCNEPLYHSEYVIVHYATSAMKRFLTSVSLQHEPKASDVITLVRKRFIALVS